MPPPDDSPLLIFDLDGTVLRINSFPRWALCMATARVGGLRAAPRVRLALQTQVLLLRRKLGRIHHEAILTELAAAWRGACGPAAEQAAAAFAAGLLRHVRPELRGLLDRVAAGEVDAILATAAAQDYALALGRALGFRIVIASDDSGWNRGERKRDRTLDYIAKRGWSGRRRIFFTDHEEDLPLIRASHAVCWFGPRAALGTLRDAAPGVAVVAADRMQAANMLTAFAALPRQVRQRASTVP